MSRGRSGDRAVSSRIRDELTLIVDGGTCAPCVELLDETGLWHTCFPRREDAWCGAAAAVHPEGDVWVHTMLLLEKLEPGFADAGLGTLLHDIGAGYFSSA